MTWLKSPFNYIGNKHRIMDQLHPHLPRDAGLMVDLFCGGGDVSINAHAGCVVANDINMHVIGIFNEFKRLGCERTLAEIDAVIARWGLSKTNEDGYLRFREHYNRTRRPLELYVLMCHGFNYQFRFNAAHEFNNPFGRARSSFNPAMRRNLERMFPVLDGISFESADFADFDYDRLGRGDFLYADPPYLLTCSSYNDGRRGFRGWTEDDDRRLFAILDMLHARGVRFALSNVARHKGRTHSGLLEWAASGGRRIRPIRFGYDNCNYHARNREHATEEILVTSF